MKKRRVPPNKRRRSGPGRGDNALVQDRLAGRRLLAMFGITHPDRELRQFREEHR